MMHQAFNLLPTLPFPLNSKSLWMIPKLVMEITANQSNLGKVKKKKLVKVKLEQGEQTTTYNLTFSRAEPPGTKIAAVKIYPAFGVGRVGNSPTDYFIGPETPGHVRSLEDPENPENKEFKYKDECGRVKRQATRFRVYAYDKHNSKLGYDDAEPFEELTLDSEEVESNNVACRDSKKETSNRLDVGPLY
eukprot:TRINITY_DN9790_c0_g1_i1.p1 TRINITY_DN9790_c0_g1~~TRINITY_DN9790_c0_g1_i1.p1  ORF type:complete len:190 (+),score=21.24 TRINITY_DN9790_c0_g1_i1:96-665(+)